MAQWLITNTGDAVVNLDQCTHAQITTPAGTVRFYFQSGSSESSLTVSFGSTDAAARTGLAKVTQALDPAIYF